jgi:hypothetical protein
MDYKRGCLGYPGAAVPSGLTLGLSITTL